MITSNKYSRVACSLARVRARAASACAAARCLLLALRHTLRSSPMLVARRDRCSTIAVIDRYDPPPPPPPPPSKLGSAAAAAYRTLARQTLLARLRAPLFLASFCVPRTRARLCARACHLEKRVCNNFDWLPSITRKKKRQSALQTAASKVRKRAGGRRFKWRAVRTKNKCRAAARRPSMRRLRWRELINDATPLLPFQTRRRRQQTRSF